MKKLKPVFSDVEGQDRDPTAIQGRLDQEVAPGQLLK